MLHVLGAAQGRQRGLRRRRARRSTESSRISEELGLRYMAQWSKRSLGQLELAAGEPVAAERALRESWDVLVEMGLTARSARPPCRSRRRCMRRAATTRPTRR